MIDNDILKKFEKIEVLSNSFLNVFGPEFTNTLEGHIETDIAGAASVAGLMILRETVENLDKYDPGTVILSEVHERQGDLFQFIANVATILNLNPSKGWNTTIPTKNEAKFSSLELSDKLENLFIEICEKEKTDKKYYPYIAALTAMKLVAAGSQMGVLDQNIGKGIVTYYIVAGAKTVPHKLERDEKN